MTIWAIFLCVTSLDQCQVSGGETFRSRAGCEHRLAVTNHAADNPKMRFRCMSRHVETWR